MTAAIETPPPAAGLASRWLGEGAKGRTWSEDTFIPRVGPWALYGLLFTIVLLFALRGEAVTTRPLDVVRIAVPLLVYFAAMWGVGMVTGRGLGLGYARSTTLAFTAAGNNFELAIAVAIGTFGATSGQALAGVVGGCLCSSPWCTCPCGPAGSSPPRPCQLGSPAWWTGRQAGDLT